MPDVDPVLKHLVPPAGSDIDLEMWRDAVVKYRQRGDWLAWLMSGDFGGVVTGEAVAEMAERLESVTAERDALLVRTTVGDRTTIGGHRAAPTPVIWVVGPEGQRLGFQGAGEVPLLPGWRIE